MTFTTPPIPKYYLLAERLRSQIQDGSLRPDDRLPTEAMLCERYDVSRGTVREALRLLHQEGLVRREQGRGTFVRAAPAGSTLFTLSGFDEMMRQQQRRPGTRLLRAVERQADESAASRLELPEGAPVFEIERLRLADGLPIVHETRILSTSLCPQLLGEDLATASIHALLVHKFRIPLVRMEHVVEAGRLDARQAVLLEAPAGSTAFFVDRLTYTQSSGQKLPAVWFQAVYCDELFQIGTRISPSL